MIFRSSSSGPRSDSRPEDRRHKIQLSEDQLHGPFNFMDHRPRKNRSKTSATVTSSRDEVKFQLRSDLQQLIDNKEVLTQKNPTLVDLSSEASPESQHPKSPPVVDLSQSDTQEIRDLFQTLVSPWLSLRFTGWNNELCTYNF